MVRQILKEYNVKGGKMDQHFLIDAAALDEIIDAARLEPADIVLEIGGGIGNLSERIAPRVSKLIIIELDPQMVRVLKSRLSVYENIEIIQGNVMDIDLSKLQFNKIVANLPYSISSDVTLKFLQHKFDLAVLMYQYEFAQRLTADSGGKDYGRLSVHVQYKTDASLILKVPKESFEPAPKVDSAVIQLIPRPASYAVEDEKFFFAVTKALFSQRRKKIKNTLLGSPLKSEIPDLKDVLDNLSDQPLDNSLVSNALQNKTVGDLLSMRAEELSPADIAYFSNLLYGKKSK
ncbi:Ribosomal RNA small subunit methyltransferase A [Methanimicrococcus hongohii]|uniref:Probable ribosomal RNA small subunit methyltransferase A n=1 Tax=Methanimicrococcus hongohii TaxID=3028295 RepID=A0AA96ZTD5_9EURY|nr:16S rRNA (adenine(1518)-N(6)/adenine(1519)-N(6))-dimethyltransferase RsmA [Methanimicrococcus sp. Hf6]WNY24455.1 Ribosomal RNA small subunit methyltransferase A [Methanimicrococcus sp. Hf6]